MGKVKVGPGETWEQVAERTSGKATIAGIIGANPGAAEDKDPQAGSMVEVPGYGMENDNDFENDVQGPGRGTAFDEGTTADTDKGADADDQDDDTDEDDVDENGADREAAADADADDQDDGTDQP